MREWYGVLKDRWQVLLTEYGATAIAIWFTLFASVWFGFYLMISAGLYEATGDSGSFWGRVGAAYLATQVSKPVRLLVTLSLTPFVGRWVSKRRAAAHEKSQSGV